MSSGYGHSAKFMQCKDGKPKLVPALQDQHHHIPVPDAERPEVRSGRVAFTLQFRKGKVDMRPLVIRPA